MDDQHQVYNDSADELYQNAKYSDITRYFCAAAHWDREFRDYVFSTIVDEEHRAISQVIDVDLVTVVKHCFAARRRETIRNVALVLILLLFLLGFSFLLIKLENKLWALYFTALCAILIWLTVFIELWYCYCTTILGQLTREKFDPDAINIQLDPQLKQKLIEVQTANTVIYRNAPREKLFEEPFIIGSGFSYKKWPPLQVDITKGKRTLDTVSPPKRFRLEELYDYLTERLKKLKISELTTTDRFFVHGQLIRKDQRFLISPSARPCLRIKDSEIMWLVEGRDISEHVRYYKCIQLRIPQTLLVASAFIRFSVIGSNLDTEVGFYLLPPITDRYYEIDNSVFTTVAFRVLKASFPVMSYLLLHAPVHLIDTLLLYPLSRWYHRKRTERRIKKNLHFDYGAISNIRMFERLNSLDYFGAVDTKKYVTSVERCILESLYEFLDSKNIDIADSKRQGTIIINAGLTFHDSTINTENIAVGDKNIVIGRQTSQQSSAKQKDSGS